MWYKRLAMEDEAMELAKQRGVRFGIIYLHASVPKTIK